MSNTGSYSQNQQIYSLASITNSAGGTSFSSFSAMQEYVTAVTTATLGDSKIQSYIGSDWVPVWGPIVYSFSPDSTQVVSDNAMALYYSPGLNLFIVTIAGTNENSAFDWLQEDFNVGNTVSWSSIVNIPSLNIPPNASIAAGYSTALNILVNVMKSGNQTMLQSLQAYISANSISGATLAVSGHSLGGGLAPVLGLYMLNIQADSSRNWNSGNGVSTIAVMPTAGPTPGESNFAAYYESQISDTFTYTHLYNTIDVVPQAWETDNMETIPGIYDQWITNPAPSTMLGPVVLGGLFKTINSNSMTPVDYTVINTRTPLSGTFSSTVNTYASTAVQTNFKALSLPSDSSLAGYENGLNSLASYFAQMVYQHTVAYSGTVFAGIAFSQGLLNIGNFTARFSVIKSNIQPGTSDEEVFNRRVSKAISKYVPVAGMKPIVFSKD